MLIRTQIQTVQLARSAEPPPQDSQLSEARLVHQLWQRDRHRHYHLALLARQAGEQAVVQALPLGPANGFAALVGAGQQFAASTSKDAPHRAAARTIVAQLTEDLALLTAPAALATAIAHQWQRYRASPAEVLSEELYFSRQIVGVAAAGQPVMRASSLPRHEVADEMAFCWLSVRREQRPAELFAELLERSEVLVFRPRAPLSAFLVTTPLDSQQMVLGQACGHKREELETLFNHVAMAAPELGPMTLSAAVGSKDFAQQHRLRERGFVQQRGLKFITLGLG